MERRFKFQYKTTFSLETAAWNCCAAKIGHIILKFLVSSLSATLSHIHKFVSKYRNSCSPKDFAKIQKMSQNL